MYVHSLCILCTDIFLNPSLSADLQMAVPQAWFWTAEPPTPLPFRSTMAMSYSRVSDTTDLLNGTPKATSRHAFRHAQKCTKIAVKYVATTCKLEHGKKLHDLFCHAHGSPLILMGVT